LHNHGDSSAAIWSGTSLPRITGSAGSHRTGAPTGPRPSRPTQRQATDILVLVSTDIPVRFPLTFSCVSKPGGGSAPNHGYCAREPVPFGQKSCCHSREISQQRRRGRRDGGFRRRHPRRRTRRGREADPILKSRLCRQRCRQVSLGLRRGTVRRTPIQRPRCRSGRSPPPRVREAHARLDSAK
jgi:hypothetical protein